MSNQLIYDKVWMRCRYILQYIVNTIVAHINITSTDKIIKVKLNCKNVYQFKTNILL
jgi:hypothetical protein